MTAERLTALIRERLDQHRNHLAIREIGAAAQRPNSAIEHDAVVLDLRTRIAELEYLLRYADGAVAMQLADQGVSE